ncbi:MAG: hypothetical protein ACLRFE_01990 [Clostridia bacterium]
MKTKANNKLNILLVAITLLLFLVAIFNSVGQTGSWLSTREQIGFELNVQQIDIAINQGSRQINNGGNVYLGTNTLVSDQTYLNSEETKVTITNNETGMGYYIRFQVIAKSEDKVYNMNNCITSSDFYSRTVADGNWLYSVDGSNNNVAMTTQQTLTMIKDVKFPQSFIEDTAGKLVRFYLIVEGSATGIFDN